MKILHIYPQLNSGGTEMVIYNILRYCGSEDYSFELLTEAPGDNEEKFSELGIPIHHLPMQDKKTYFNSLVNFFTAGDYSVVHVHMNHHLPLVLRAAKKVGIRCRIAHSHNARLDLPQIVWKLLYIKHHSFEKFATHFIGCSKLALKWLFPSKWKDGKVIQNGIPMDEFKFNPEIRTSIRNKLGILPNTKVFINVGRCTTQKNQQFILDLADKRKKNDELYLIVGEGPDLEKLKFYAEEKELKNVRFLGKRNDVANLLMGADIFLFPSIYEGLGIVAIEAQAAGMNVISSDQIPSEADLHLGNFNTISLKQADLWHNAMDGELVSDNKRFEISHQAYTSSYNINNSVIELKKIYDSNL